MSASTKKSTYSVSYIVKIVVMLALMFGIGMLPPIGEITEVGMKVLGTFVGLLFGWSCLGIIFPCLAGFVALSFSGVGTASEITTGCFGSEVVILLVTMYAIIDVLDKSGVNDYLVNKLLSIKALQGHPWVFSYIIILACYLSGIIVGGFVAMLLIWGIIYKVAKIMGLKPYAPYPTCLMIGTTIAGAMSSVVFPFLATALFLGSSYTAMSGIPIDYAKFMVFCIPGALFTFFIFIMIMRFVFRINLDSLKNADIQTIVGSEKLLQQKNKRPYLRYLVLLWC